MLKDLKRIRREIDAIIRQHVGDQQEASPSAALQLRRIIAELRDMVAEMDPLQESFALVPPLPTEGQVAAAHFQTKARAARRGMKKPRQAPVGNNAARRRLDAGRPSLANESDTGDHSLIAAEYDATLQAWVNDGKKRITALLARYDAKADNQGWRELALAMAFAHKEPGFRIEDLEYDPHSERRNEINEAIDREMYSELVTVETDQGSLIYVTEFEDSSMSQERAAKRVADRINTPIKRQINEVVSLINSETAHHGARELDALLDQQDELERKLVLDKTIRVQYSVSNNANWASGRDARDRPLPYFLRTYINSLNIMQMMQKIAAALTESEDGRYYRGREGQRERQRNLAERSYRSSVL